MSASNPILLTVISYERGTLVESPNFTGCVPRRGDFVYIENEKRIKVSHRVTDVVWSYDKDMTRPTTVLVYTR